MAVQLTCCSRACNTLDRRARSTCSSRPAVDSSRRSVDRKHASPVQGRCGACTGRGWDDGSRRRPASSRRLCTTVSDAFRRSRLLYRHTTGLFTVHNTSRSDAGINSLRPYTSKSDFDTGILMRNHSQATQAFIRLLSLSCYSLSRYLVKNISHNS